MIDTKARLARILAEARRNPVKTGDIQSAGILKEVMDSKTASAVTRFGHVEAYLIPAEMFRELIK